MFVPPESLQLGPLTIHFYSLFILLGIVLAYYVAKPAARRVGLSPEQLQLSIFYGMIPGIIGARAYHVIDLWDYYAANPSAILIIWQGGLGIIGGLVGGAAGLYWFARRHRKPWLSILDIWAPSVLIGQAVGRFGNWTNQEAFGPPTDGPTGIFIDPAHRPEEFAAVTHFHPTFFYEAGLDILAFVLLFRPKSRIRNWLGQKPGAVLGAYFIAFGVIRFAIEFYRTETAELVGVPLAQIIAVTLIVVGAYLVGRPTPAGTPPAG